MHSQSFDEASLTDAGLFALAVLTTVCVEQEANRERQLAGRSNSAVLGRGSGGEPFFRRKKGSPVSAVLGGGVPV